MVIDCHTHAFPDWLAEKAMEALDANTLVPAYHDATLAGLEASMDAAGIDRAFICSIATKPAQFEPILQWSEQILSPRFVPLCSVHPEDPQAAEKIHTLPEKGIQGIKLHPYYQGFSLDDPRMRPVFQALQDTGLFVVCHTGFDIAFPDRELLCDPPKIVALTEAFPELRFVAAHFGGWEHWDAVKQHIIGKPVYIETSFVLETLPREAVREMIMAHPEEYILFGTDSPWTDQSKALGLFKDLDLPSKLEEKILCGNALRLLNQAA